jgi:hypothetical protein
MPDLDNKGLLLQFRFDVLFVQLEVLVALLCLMVQNVIQGHKPLEGLLMVPSNKGSLTTAGQGNQIHPLMENIWTSWKENANGRRTWLTLMSDFLFGGAISGE